MFLKIFEILLLHWQVASVLSLEDIPISKVSKTTVPEDKNRNTIEIYSILVPPDWILQICLKETTLLNQLRSHVNDCANFACMFSKVIETESMKSVLSIVRNDTINDAIKQEFRQSVKDCLMWWKLFKHFDRNANSREELGRCLFQTFSTKCKDSTMDKIKSFLMVNEEKQS